MNKFSHHFSLKKHKILHNNHKNLHNFHKNLHNFHKNSHNNCSFVTIRTCWFGEKIIEKLNNATKNSDGKLNTCSKCKKYITSKFQKPPTPTTKTLQYEKQYTKIMQ